MATHKRLVEEDSVMACCEANPDVAIGVVKGVVMMVPSDAEDSSQQWRLVKSETDPWGEQSYYLVNIGTKEALTAGSGTLASYISARNFQGSDIKPDNMAWVPAKDIKVSILDIFFSTRLLTGQEASQQACMRRYDRFP